MHPFDSESLGSNAITKNYRIESGMVTNVVVLGILAVVSVSLLVMHATYMCTLCIDAQNRADLAAISAAQIYMNSNDDAVACSRVKAMIHAYNLTCMRDADNFTITLTAPAPLPWILPEIEAKATAGPVSVEPDG